MFSVEQLGVATSIRIEASKIYPPKPLRCQHCTRFLWWFHRVQTRSPSETWSFQVAMDVWVVVVWPFAHERISPTPPRWSLASLSPVTNDGSDWRTDGITWQGQSQCWSDLCRQVFDWWSERALERESNTRDVHGRPWGRRCSRESFCGDLVFHNHNLDRNWTWPGPIILPHYKTRVSSHHISPACCQRDFFTSPMWRRHFLNFKKKLLSMPNIDNWSIRCCI